MARGGSYFPNKFTHNTQEKGPTNKKPTNQTPTDKAPKTKGGQTQGGKRPKHREADTKTRENRQRDKEELKKSVEAPWIRGGRNRERGAAQRGAEQNTNTGTPTQREAGSREAAQTGGGGARKDQNGYSHALVDVQRGPGTSKMNTSVQQRRAMPRRSKVV